MLSLYIWWRYGAGIRFLDWAFFTACFLASLPYALYKLWLCPASFPAAFLLGMASNDSGAPENTLFKCQWFASAIWIPRDIFTFCCLQTPSHQILSLQINDYALENFRVIPWWLVLFAFYSMYFLFIAETPVSSLWMLSLWFLIWKWLSLVIYNPLNSPVRIWD